MAPESTLQQDFVLRMQELMYFMSLGEEKKSYRRNAIKGQLGLAMVILAHYSLT